MKTRQQGTCSLILDLLSPIFQDFPAEIKIEIARYHIIWDFTFNCE